MAEFYNTDKKVIKTDTEIRAENPNVSFPKVLSTAALEGTNYVPVLASGKPNPSDLTKIIARDGVEQDLQGNWIEKWAEKDRHTEYVDGDGKTITKDSQDTAFQTERNIFLAKLGREKRNGLLAETDWMALGDVTMADTWKTYRQQLRDLPAQSGFPDIDFPTKPE